MKEGEEERGQRVMMRAQVRQLIKGIARFGPRNSHFSEEVLEKGDPHSSPRREKSDIRTLAEGERESERRLC